MLNAFSFLYGNVSDSLNCSIIYENAYKIAIKDNHISNEESALLNSLQHSLNLQKMEIQKIQMSIKLSQKNALDQSGRWPLMIQNIGWGAGFYGWALPYALNIDDFKWYVASELMSFSAAFYLTHQYTKGMNIDHARTQMNRLGSGMGFHYGWSLCDVFKINPDYYDNRNWVWLLMTSVPAGMYVGDRLYQQWQPTNGQSWAITLSTIVSLLSVNNIHHIVDKKPEEPMYDAVYDPLNNQYDMDWDEFEETEKYKNYEKNLEEWKQMQGLLMMLAYPAGLYVGNQYFSKKQTSFGDALLLYQGYGFGMLYTMAGLDLIGTESDDIFLSGLIVGGLAGIYSYEKIFSDYDYSFGESVLTMAGTVSGSLFGLGLGVILESNKQFMEFAAITGGITGTYLTQKIIYPATELSIKSNDDIKISVLPGMNFYSNKLGNQFAPGINIEIKF